jgi:cytochrome c peroxidase
VTLPARGALGGVAFGGVALGCVALAGAALTSRSIGACAGPAVGPALEAGERARIESLSPLPPPPPSPENPVADDERAAELGRAYFFEARWSADGASSCASCHDPSREHADGRALPRARGHVGRHTPGLRGSAWMRWQAWDGRRDSVWSQALAPLESELEQGSSRARVARVVALHHAAAHEAVFGALPAALDASALPPDARPVPVEPAHPHARAWAALDLAQRDAVDPVFLDVGRALEAYVRRLAPGEAPLDRFVAALRRGEPRAADHLGDAGLRGLRAFVGEAGCFDCHHGPLLSDGEFHNLALPGRIGASERDRGRAEGARALLSSEHRCGGPRPRLGLPRAAPRCDELRFLDPARPELEGAFRTPTLRNVTRTAPYMHGGQLARLEDVLAFYRTLAGPARVGRRDHVLHALPRSVSTGDLLAFLASLEGEPLPARWTSPPPAPQALEARAPER